MTVCFINFSRHSIIVDRAHGIGLIILAQTTKFAITVLAAVLNDNYCLQCFDAVGWVAGRASGL